MKILSRIVALLLFLIFFGFALKNTDPVTLHFFLNYESQGPLVLMLLIFFAVGAVLGVLAMVPTLMRYRRSEAKTRKMLVQMEKESAQIAGRTVSSVDIDRNL